MSDDVALLNAARWWWQDHIPDIGRVPTEEEILEAYAKRDQDVAVIIWGLALRRLNRLKESAAESAD